THGRRLFWLHGGWHEDGWRGPRPAGIDWQSRGGSSHGFRPGIHVHDGIHDGRRSWDERNHFRGPHDGDGGNRPWTGSGNHPWQGGRDNGGDSGGDRHFGVGNRGDGGNNFGGGDGGSHFGGGSRGGLGGHGPH